MSAMVISFYIYFNKEKYEVTPSPQIFYQHNGICTDILRTPILMLL